MTKYIKNKSSNCNKYLFNIKFQASQKSLSIKDENKEINRKDEEIA